MDKYLMSMITKSPIDNEMIKGPFFTLTVQEAKSIIRHLKSIGRWNVDYISDNALIIEPEILFQKLSIFPKDFRDDKFLYSFDTVEVSSFFNLNNYEEGLILVLVAKKKNLTDIVFRICLGEATGSVLYDKYKFLLSEQEEVLINETDIEYFLNREYTKGFYEFNNSKFDYFITMQPPLEYVFEPSKEDWWEMNELTQMPFSFINK